VVHGIHVHSDQHSAQTSPVLTRERIPEVSPFGIEQTFRAGALPGDGVEFDADALRADQIREEIYEREIAAYSCDGSGSKNG
jgi:hypothetical protein